MVLNLNDIIGRNHGETRNVPPEKTEFNVYVGLDYPKYFDTRIFYHGIETGEKDWITNNIGRLYSTIDDFVDTEFVPKYQKGIRELYNRCTHEELKRLCEQVESSIDPEKLKTEFKILFTRRIEGTITTGNPDKDTLKIFRDNTYQEILEKNETEYIEGTKIIQGMNDDEVLSKISELDESGRSEEARKYDDAYSIRLGNPSPAVYAQKLVDKLLSEGIIKSMTRSDQDGSFYRVKSEHKEEKQEREQPIITDDFEVRVEYSNEQIKLVASYMTKFPGKTDFFFFKPQIQE